MVGRIIETDSCVAEGAAWLSDREPRFADALRLTGPLPLRRRENGFRALLDAIVSQQISVAAANAIWARMEAAGATNSTGLLARSSEELRVCGLSAQKIKYARGLAESGLDYRELVELPDTEVTSRLVALKGIGTWTAEIYAMFSLGRADVFAPGDLALQEAYRTLFGLDRRPDERQFRTLAEAWSPWRAVAARLLWAYYKVSRKKDGISI